MNKRWQWNEFIEEFREGQGYHEKALDANVTLRQEPPSASVFHFPSVESSDEDGRQTCYGR